MLTTRSEMGSHDQACGDCPGQAQTSWWKKMRQRVGTHYDPYETSPW